MSWLAALAAVVAAAGAAKPPTAAQVVADVDAHYQQTNGLRADFTQEYANTIVGKTTKSSGELLVEKPGNMRWDYATPQQNYFVSDGKTLWAVDKPNKQVIAQSLTGSLLPTAVTFLYGKGSLAQEFNATFDATGCRSKKNYCVKLTPKQASAQYSAIWLSIDKRDSHVAESNVLEPSGNTNHFWFKHARNPGKLQKGTFHVNVKKLQKDGYTLVAPGTTP